MDFIKIFEEQQKFEVRLDKSDPAVLKKKIMSLIVETGESLNERPAILKYWSKCQKPSSVKLAEHYARVYEKEPIFDKHDTFLEELVDMFTFIISIGIELEINPTDLEPNTSLYDEQDIVDLYFLFSRSVLNLYTEIQVERPVRYKLPSYQDVLNTFLALLISLGYTLPQLENVFYDKNAVNHVRQDQAY